MAGRVALDDRLAHGRVRVRERGLHVACGGRPTARSGRSRAPRPSSAGTTASQSAKRAPPRAVQRLERVVLPAAATCGSSRACAGRSRSRPGRRRSRASPRRRRSSSPCRRRPSRAPPCARRRAAVRSVGRVVELRPAHEEPLVARALEELLLREVRERLDVLRRLELGDRLLHPLRRRRPAVVPVDAEVAARDVELVVRPTPPQVKPVVMPCSRRRRRRSAAWWCTGVSNDSSAWYSFCRRSRATTGTRRVAHLVDDAALRVDELGRDLHAPADEVLERVEEVALALSSSSPRRERRGRGRRSGAPASAGRRARPTRGSRCSSCRPGGRPRRSGGCRSPRPCAGRRSSPRRSRASRRSPRRARSRRRSGVRRRSPASGASSAAGIGSVDSPAAEIAAHARGARRDPRRRSSRAPRSRPAAAPVAASASARPRADAFTDRDPHVAVAPRRPHHRAGERARARTPSSPSRRAPRTGRPAPARSPRSTQARPTTRPLPYVRTATTGEPPACTSTSPAGWYR